MAFACCEILGIDEYAPLDEVNRAYKRLSLVYHPDKTKGMTAQQQEDYETIFISVKNAHLVLGDQPTRRQYDKDRDQDKAKEVVSGVKAPSSQHVDLTEVLKRISEMQRPPGKVVEVPLEVELEQFFYGVHKAISRERRVKDFYAGMINQEHVYRFHVPRGAREPLELTFKEQGDHNPDTRPDTVKFCVTARPHGVVTRRERDLVRKEARLVATQIEDLGSMAWARTFSFPLDRWRRHSSYVACQSTAQSCLLQFGGVLYRSSAWASRAEAEVKLEDASAGPVADRAKDIEKLKLALIAGCSFGEGTHSTAAGGARRPCEHTQCLKLCEGLIASVSIPPLW
ncbi:dnaJ [Symbiodinium natans]|uniref:DnaJ protein n=1 Tax=Symbiodinium natans TaxID=878477 RepID=A0A812NSM6_9DINO|nr:dnaJ [Symbiodinium natans]